MLRSYSIHNLKIILNSSSSLHNSELLKLLCVQLFPMTKNKYTLSLFLIFVPALPIEMRNSHHTPSLNDNVYFTTVCRC